jgi:hypothetical protein
VCREVWPRRVGKREGVCGSLSRSDPTTGVNNLWWPRQRGWLVESDTAYGVQGKVREEICGFECVGLILMWLG